MVELHWDGKYSNGKRSSPLRIALPFQTVETINEGTAQRVQQLDLLNQGKPTEWRNRLIWGDKKYVLPSLLPEFAGKVNLIYIDPPFNTGADFSYTATIPNYNDDEEQEEETFTKEPSILEQKAYRDTWGKGLDSYLQWFYETVVLLRELLADNGSIYVHLDWHVGHYAKIVLDEVFGYENFRNEIIVKRIRKNVREREKVKSLNTAQDVVLFYSKTEEHLIIPPTRFNPRPKRWHSFEASGVRKDMDYELFGRRPSAGNHWRWTKEKAEIAIRDGKLRPNPKTGTPEYLIKETETELIDSVWFDVPAYSFSNKYKTEKSELLLERIIKTSSNEGDLVLDCFCGSGTTAAVAEKLNRRWIACDLGRFAIHTTRKRLLSIPNVKPFVVQNLGKYERQEWQKAEFVTKVDIPSIEQQYRKFILDLYHAVPITGFIYLHGTKGRHLVHVGAVDAPVTISDVKEIIKEFWNSVGTSKDIRENVIDILGWEFALEMNETARQLAEQNKVTLHFKKIPREVLEKRAVEQGDIQFFELCALNVEYKLVKRKITVTLKDFIIHPDDVPEEVRQKVKHWSQWIDYWAVDWDYKNDTFHNQSTTFRTRRDPNLLLSLSHEYESKGNYTVLIKVIDILGNDTTKAIQVRVP